MHRWQLWWCISLVALRGAGSPLTRDRTGVPFITRQVLNHWPTREARHLLFNMGKMVKGFLGFVYVALMAQFLVFQRFEHECIWYHHTHYSVYI